MLQRSHRPSPTQHFPAPVTACGAHNPVRFHLLDHARRTGVAHTQPPLNQRGGSLFGGYYPGHGIFTEEFIPGETVERQVARLERQGEPRRLRHVWPFLGWTALSAHVDFWDRTGRRVALRHPSLAAFIVPSHDYQTGARLVSIADRSPCERFEELRDRFQRAFVDTVESTRPALRGGISDALFFSAAVEPLGLAGPAPCWRGSWAARAARPPRLPGEGARRGLHAAGPLPR